MKKQVLALFICISIILYGCPYQSHHSIGEPGTEEIDFKLSGTWLNFNKFEKLRKIDIRPVNKFEYRIELVDADEFNQLKTKEFTGYITHIGEHPILYVKPNGQRDVMYYYFTYQIDNDGVLHLRAVDNTKIDRYQTISREKMVEYFKSNVNSTGFFTDPTQFKRLTISNAQLN